MEACTTAEDCRGGAPGAEWQCDDVSIIGFKSGKMHPNTTVVLVINWFSAADSLSKMEQAILWYLSLASIVVLLTCEGLAFWVPCTELYNIAMRNKEI